VISAVSTLDSAYIASQTPALSSITRQAFWTATEAALVMQCSARTLRTELSRGIVKGIKIGGKWRVPASQFGVHLMPFVVYETAASKASEVESDRSSAYVEIPNILETPKTPLEAHAIPPPQPAQPTLRLNLLGRPQIFIDDVRLVELERSNRRSELLYLLALHRDGLSGAQLGHMLNATNQKHEDESLDPHYVRTLVWGVRDHTRKKCGWDGVVTSAVQHGRGAQRYTLPANTTCDLWEFQEKLNRADALTANVARLMESSKSLLTRTLPLLTSEVGQYTQNAMYTPTQAEVLALAATLRDEALRLYRGDLCDGSANGCLAEAARVIQGRFISSAIEQGDYWRWAACRTQEANKSYFSSIKVLSEVMQAGAELFPAEVRLFANLDTGALSAQRHPYVRAAWREALHNYERILEVDPYYEDACVCAMECYAALGNMRGMHSRFTTYRELLRKDLQQEPGNRIVHAFEVLENRSAPGLALAT
jgi:hypothetical protein